MAETSPSWLDAAPPDLRAALTRTAGGLAPNVALMQILAACAKPGDAGDTLRAAIGSAAENGAGAAMARLQAVLRLHEAKPDAHAIVHAILSGIDHGASATGASAGAWGATFDNAARMHPEASVALYALGDADLLNRATQEVIERLDAWGHIAADVDCIDIGCGIGRFEAALAGRVRSILGVDVSAAMVAEARRRTAGLVNVDIRQGSGADLNGLEDCRFDLALAVDSFPYMVMSADALVRSMLAESARVLRPGGRMVIFNYSYRGNPGRDAEELARHARGADLEIGEPRDARFTLWDATVFELRKPHRAA